MDEAVAAQPAIENRPAIEMIATGAPSPDDIAVLDSGLTSFNLKTLKTDARPFAIFLRKNKDIKGGICGTIRPDIFLIKKLWIDDSLRGRRFGQRLVKACEDKARDSGCERLVVDTMSFQAPDFYKKLGFRETARVENFYARHDRVFLEKSLKDKAGDR